MKSAPAPWKSSDRGNLPIPTENITFTDPLNMNPGVKKRYFASIGLYYIFKNDDAGVRANEKTPLKTKLYPVKSLRKKR